METRSALKGGTYPLVDAKTGEVLKLEYVGVGVVGAEGLWRIHDASRLVSGTGGFACVLFHPIGGPKDELYDVDFWVKRQDGKIAVEEMGIHKEPHLIGKKWVRVERYAWTKGR